MRCLRVLTRAHAGVVGVGDWQCIRGRLDDLSERIQRRAIRLISSIGQLKARRVSYCYLQGVIKLSVHSVLLLFAIEGDL